MQTLSSFSIPTPDLPPLDDSLILGLLAQQTIPAPIIQTFLRILKNTLTLLRAVNFAEPTTNRSTPSCMWANAWRDLSDMTSIWNFGRVTT